MQRTLVNLDMIKDDIAMLPAHAYASASHQKLVRQYRELLVSIDALLPQVTEKQFRTFTAQTELCHLLSQKQMVGVQQKMISSVLAYWDADQKAQGILAAEFDPQADKRLDLLQVKAVRAKSQLKTVADAMGKADYQAFVSALGLAGTELEWSQLCARE
ncbi:hypothetical protein [Alteromonas halophila]|nr:hypothetical protein [Alteromonas halophila]